MTDTTKQYVIGIDYGTDSCRAVVTDAQDGREIASAVAQYPRWGEGRYCNASNNQFRQHPQDYIDSLVAVMDEIAGKTGTEVLPFIKGIAIDTTGSTPCLVTARVEPLAMLLSLPITECDVYALKDHTATDEAFEINALAHKWKIDFTMYEEGCTPQNGSGRSCCISREQP
jgi:L-ribulokinase